MQLTEADKSILLMQARTSIRSLFETVNPFWIDYKVYPNLKLNAGVFVTLHLQNNLRGCIGYITAATPLFDTVCEVAKLSATEDPRFYPLSASELDEVQIEISVLSPMQPINDFNQIVIGKHGLFLKHGADQGLLLPQVATEHKMNREQFLDAICNKARLPEDLWRTEKLNLSVFTAEVFSEQKHKMLTDES